METNIVSRRCEESVQVALSCWTAFWHILAGLERLSASSSVPTVTGVLTIAAPRRVLGRHFAASFAPTLGQPPAQSGSKQNMVVQAKTFLGETAYANTDGLK
jgi:hypothetical protein